MGEIAYVTVDFARFTYRGFDPGKGKVVDRKTTLYWGDKVEILETNGARTTIRALELFNGQVEGRVKTSSLGPDPKVMRFSMVDVQQGDGMIFETPPDADHNRKIMFVDGGDNKLFARHAAARFQHRQPSEASPLPVEIILITHGDADHFDGLNQIRRTETDSSISKRKQLFIHPKAILHNGLVKLPSTMDALDANGDPILKPNGKPKRVSRPDVEMFGPTATYDGDTYVTHLLDDPRESEIRPLNKYFEYWIDTLDRWETRGDITMQRVDQTTDADTAFAGMAPLQFEIQGPFTDTLTVDGDAVPALPFLHTPGKDANLHHGTSGHSSSLSDSHTVNGHSIALRITYGNVRISLTGDHNQESMARMREHVDLDDLEAEILKAPHHGSHDFDYDMLEAISPVVSLVSSGDESAKKEHVHPRATLMAALGRVSRTKTSLVLSTELTSFYAMRDYSHTREDLADYFEAEGDDPLTRKSLQDSFRKQRRSREERKALADFFAFERTNFGIIHVRTDGERVLVFTHTGKALGHEAYAFSVDSDHEVTFHKDVKKG